MITLKHLTDKHEIADWMTCSEKLFLTAMTDLDISIYKEGKWKPDLHKDKYILFQIEDTREPIGLVRYCDLTNITVEHHWYIYPEFWGKGKSFELLELFIKYLKENTQHKKMVTFSPSYCKEVIKATCTHGGHGIEGALTKAIMWRGELCDLIILAREI